MEASKLFNSKIMKTFIVISFCFMVRLMAMYQQSNNKAEFLETLKSFQLLIVNEEQQIYRKMLSDNFEIPMEELYASYCTAIHGKEFIKIFLKFINVPNAQSTFPYSNDIVVLKAIQPIQPGEELCISYLGECQLESIRHSRQNLITFRNVN